MVDIVKTTLDTCPAELAGDVMDRGIALTGGGALLRDLDERLCEETGMPIQLVPHQATFARLTIRRRRGSLVWRFRQAM